MYFKFKIINDLGIFLGGYIFQDDEDVKNGRPIESGITQILRGSSEYFPIVVVDRGYDILPKNVKKDRIGNAIRKKSTLLFLSCLYFYFSCIEEVC